MNTDEIKRAIQEACGGIDADQIAIVVDPRGGRNLAKVVLRPEQLAAMGKSADIVKMISDLGDKVGMIIELDVSFLPTKV